MDLELRGKRALVTGGTRGIGSRIVRALAHHGVDVVTCCRTESQASEQLSHDLAELDGQHHLAVADVSDPEQLAGVFELVDREFGELDIVVANAAILSHTPYAELSLAEWQRMINTNLTGTHLTIQGALPYLGHGGSVISIGSQASNNGVAQRVHYDASKTALLGLTSSLAREYGGSGIRFNVLSLGGIITEEMDTMTDEQRQQREERYSRQTALGRLGETDEVADAVLWLSSELSSYVTGSEIRVDGGM